MTTQSANLREDGFCVARRVIDSATLAEVAAAFPPELQSPQLERASVHVPLDRLPAFHAACRLALAQVGFLEHSVWGTYAVCRRAGERSHPWHQDFLFWNQPTVAFAAEPTLVGCIAYLVDTSTHNGCLRVMPGSHRRYIPTLMHGDWLAHHPGEVDVPTSVGDLVIIDSRVWHATHANDSAHGRPMMILWSVLDGALRLLRPNAADSAAAWLAAMPAGPKEVRISRNAILPSVDE